MIKVCIKNQRFNLVNVSRQIKKIQTKIFFSKNFNLLVLKKRLLVASLKNY